MWRTASGILSGVSFHGYSGYRPEMPDLSYNNNMKGWGPDLCARRPDITMAMVDTFLTNMYRARADFVYTVTRDFVSNCQTPILVLPGRGRHGHNDAVSGSL
jgi:hypothetical protein